jgi:hypothetical protein
VALDPANFEPGGVLEGLNVTTGNGGEGTTVDLINPAGVVVVNFGVSAPPVPVTSRWALIVLALAMLGTAALLARRSARTD